MALAVSITRHHVLASLTECSGRTCLRSMISMIKGTPILVSSGWGFSDSWAMTVMFPLRNFSPRPILNDDQDWLMPWTSPRFIAS